MPVSENETAMSRGRVPSYLRRQMSQFMSSLLCRRRRFAEAQLVLLQRNGSFSSLFPSHYLHLLFSSAVSSFCADLFFSVVFCV